MIRISKEVQKSVEYEDAHDGIPDHGDEITEPEKPSANEIELTPKQLDLLRGFYFKIDKLQVEAESFYNSLVEDDPYDGQDDGSGFITTDDIPTTNDDQVNAIIDELCGLQLNNITMALNAVLNLEEAGRSIYAYFGKHGITDVPMTTAIKKRLDIIEIPSRQLYSCFFSNFMQVTLVNQINVINTIRKDDLHVRRIRG